MDFGIFDANQHYYEAEDCLTRHASKRMQAIETLVALVLQNLFGRFPNIRVAAVELGSGWFPLGVPRAASPSSPAPVAAGVGVAFPRLPRRRAGGVTTSSTRS